MANKTIVDLVEHVAQLRTDVDWIKKIIYVSVGSSVTAALGTITHIVNSLLHFHH